MRQDIDVPTPLPTNQFCYKQLRIPKHFAIDSIAEKAGVIILRLPHYHSVLNTVERGGNKLNHHVFYLNIYAKQPSKVVGLIREV